MSSPNGLVLKNDDFPYQNRRGFSKRAALLEAQNHRCAYCGVSVSHFGGDDDAATIDEVQPRSRGGQTIWSNQVIACRLCNQGRGNYNAIAYFELVAKFGRIEAPRELLRRRSNRRQSTPVILPRNFLEVS